MISGREGSSSILREQLKSVRRKLTQRLDRPGAWKLMQRLDRPGGRKILGMFATWYARKLSGADVGIFYDGAWIHRVGTDYAVDSLRFEYRRNNIMAFKSGPQALELSRDYWYHLYNPQPGDVVIDVGAGIGWDTMLFSKAVGERGKVISIEAHPLTFRMLEKQCKWNRLSNVVLCPYAIMDKRCTVYIENQPDIDANAVSLVRGPEHLREAIPGISLDELCNTLGLTRVDFVKVNIEGAERFAINGMRNTLARTRYVSIACHDFKAESGPQYATKDMIVDFLRSNDFDVVLRNDHRRYWVWDHVHGVRRDQASS